jgi:hypothetical protein
MILRAKDIPPYEMHLVPVTDLRQQIHRDRRGTSSDDPELRARERSLAAVGEGDVDWDFALAS